MTVEETTKADETSCDSARAGRCIHLRSLAAFEQHAGFPDVADTMLSSVQQCLLSGRCTAPQICFAFPGADAPQRSASILRYAVPAEPRRRSEQGGEAKVIPLQPALRAALTLDPDGNRIQQTRLSIEALRAKRGRLADLLIYWEGLYGLGRNRLGDLDPVQFSKMGLLGRMHLVNAAHADPAKFHFDIRGALVPSVPGSCMEGMPVSRHPVRILAESVMRDYALVRNTGLPLYHYIRTRLLGTNYHYRRLILPLSADGERIDRLLVALDTDGDHGEHAVARSTDGPGLSPPSAPAAC